jgi:hypothetical protein
MSSMLISVERRTRETKDDCDDDADEPGGDLDAVGLLPHRHERRVD